MLMPGKKSETGKGESSGMNPQLEALKAALAKNSVLLGSRSVLKALKTGNPKIVFMASNCPERIKGDIASSAKISGAALERFEGTAKQLGIFCGKPFAVASLAVMQEKKKNA